MSPDHDHGAEARAADLTAYALDDLDGRERDDVEQRLRDPGDIASRRHVAEMRVLASTLRQAHASRVADDAVSRLPAVRRAVLVAASRRRPRSAIGSIPRRMLPLASLVAALAVAVTAALWRHEGGDIARRARNTKPPAPGAAAAYPSVTEAAKREAGGPIVARAPAHDRMAVLRRGQSESQAESQAAPAAAAPRFGVGQDGWLDIDTPPSDPEGLAEELIRRLPPPGADSRRLAEAQERYARLAENQMATARDQPLSTFSIDVDTASYANVRRFLVAGQRPPRDAVRIEELVNYFRYGYPQPTDGKPFSVTVDAAECPWAPGHRLVRVGLQGRQIDRAARPAGNLVFLVDVSGSMGVPEKLELVKQGLRMLVGELTENDRVTIVTYAGRAGLVLPPTTGDQTQMIEAAIDGLSAGGTTYGSAGIALAYEQARAHFIEGGSNRVILATDGDLNVGVTSTDALVNLVKGNAATGIFLTVLGVGRGNLQDDKLEAIADHGNGLYAYLDSMREARKVLVEQLTGSTVVIAKDVKIQVEFNPAQVASYRLLGYENRALAALDFKDDAKDAGDIGAGHSVTALYDVTLTGAAGGGDSGEPLKYRARQADDPKAELRPAVDPAVSRELLTVKLRWKEPEGMASVLEEVPLVDRGGAFEAAPADLRFAAAVAAFGLILRESNARGEATLPLVAKIAGGALGSDDGGYRAEFLDLVRRAEAAK